jgi:MYXO-CTERM domain-containing protein
MGMRLLLVATALLISRAASANQCPALQRYVPTVEVPLGCPLVVYQDHAWHMGVVPTVTLEHAGSYRELTPTVTTESEVLAIYMETIDADCVELAGYEDRVWDRMTMDLGTVEVGDIVQVAYAYPNATITAAGACPEPAPPDSLYLYCQSPVQDYWACDDTMMPGDEVDVPDDDDDGGYFGGGCSSGKTHNAGGGLGLAGVALLLAVRRRRVTSRR